MAYVADAEAAGHLRGDVAPGALGDAGRDVEDGDGRAGADVVGGVARHRLGDDLLERGDVGAGHVVDVHEVAHLPAVLEDLRPLAPLEGGAEHRCDPGVGGVARHARAVDVVVAQGHRPGAGLTHPRRGVVLLRELARGIAAARVEAGVLGDQRPRERLRADGAVVVEVPGLEGREVARRRLLLAVERARVAPLAVDHHRRGQHQAVDAGVVHRRQQRGRTEVVVGRVRRQVADADPGPDQRGLVADDVDAAQQPGPLRRPGLAHVELVDARGRGAGAVSAVQHQVDADDLVAVRGQRPVDRAADEAGRAGEQDPHVPGTS